MADNDVQLDLKKRSRRRLVGATALALAAAIVLPMVMDREPKPATNELQIRIPGQEGSNFAARLITGNAPPPASPVLPAQSAPTGVQSHAAVTPPPVVPVSVPVATASSPSAQQSRPQTDKPAATQSTPAARREPAASKPAATSKPASEAQRARDILDGRPEPKPESKPETKETASGQKFYVQLGVFRDEANAHEVLGRAGSAGVKASAIKADDKTRLRAGPFADRSAAEAVVTKLKKAGLNGIVTSK